MNNTSKKLIATLEFCQTSFISEYSIDKLLQSWEIKNSPKSSTPAFLNDLIGFLMTIPLVCFNNSATQLGKVIEQIRKIMLEKNPGEEELARSVSQGLNIIKTKKQKIKYI